MSLFSSSDSSPPSSFSTDLSTDSTNNADQELQDFLMLEKQKAQFNAQVRI